MTVDLAEKAQCFIDPLAPSLMPCPASEDKGKIKGLDELIQVAVDIGIVRKVFWMRG